MLDGHLWWHVALLALLVGFCWSAGCWLWSLVRGLTERKA